jgi:DNA-binding MarR family transcriptional regulator
VLISIIVDEEELRASLDISPLLRLVALAGHVTSQRFGRVMGRQHGLTSAGAAVLTVLNWGLGRGIEQGTPGRATHAELARRCFLTPATLTGVVDTLEKAGYVRRERDDADRRVVWLVLTDAGQERTRQLARDFVQIHQPTEAECDPAKEKIVREFLVDLIVKNYEKE